MSPEPEELSPAEKRSVFENDRKVREQQRGSTFSDFAQSEADTPRGRFTAHENSPVIGSTPVPDYPQGPNWCSADQALEPPLGYAVNDAPPPVGEPHELAASIAAQDASPEPQRTPEFAGDPTAVPPDPSLASVERVGSPSFRRRSK